MAEKKEAVEKESSVGKENTTTGEVKISSDVVRVISALAAAEADGVYTVAGSRAKSKKQETAKIRAREISKGVRVDISGEKVKVDIEIVIEYGSSIPRVSKDVQEKIAYQVESMTGLTVEAVNVRVTGVKYSD